MKKKTAPVKDPAPKDPPAKPPATAAQVRLWNAWAEAIRSAEAAGDAFDAFAGAIDAAPAPVDVAPYELADGERYEPANHLRFMLRMGLDAVIDHDVPEEVGYLLGRLEPRPGEDEVHAAVHATQRKRVLERVGRFASAEVSAV